MNALSAPPVSCQYLKVITVTITVIAILLMMIWGRAFYGSMNSFEAGTAFLEKGQYMRAVTYFDRSIHWYTPFNPYVEKSAENLWQISNQAEANGDIRLAMIAVRTLRRGFIAARSLYVPGKDWIERCDARMLKLLKIQRVNDEEARHIEIHNGSSLDTSQVRGPDVLWSLVVLAGFLGWIGSAMAFIISGRAGGRQQTNRLELSRIKWIILCALFWVVWIIGMTKA